MRMVGKSETIFRHQKIIISLMISSLFFLALFIYIFLSESPFRHELSLIQNQLNISKPETTLMNDKIKLDTSNIKNPNPSQYSSLLKEPQTPLSKIFGLKVKTIIIDPGHGGEDPGAIGKSGTMEKNLTLDIAKKLKQRLAKHKKYKILLTREEDKTLSLDDRINFANSHKSDIYISIHVNYIPSKPISIIETYCFGPHKDKKSLLLAERENRGSQYSLSDFKEIIKEIGNTLKSQESTMLALSIQQSLYGNIKKQNKKIENWGVRRAPFIVLLGVDTPSVLTEVTCLSNHLEEKKLNNENYRKEIAQYLEEGIVRYLNINQKNKGKVEYAAKRTTNQK